MFDLELEMGMRLVRRTKLMNPRGRGGVVSVAIVGGEVLAGLRDVVPALDLPDGRRVPLERPPESVRTVHAPPGSRLAAVQCLSEIELVDLERAIRLRRVPGDFQVSAGGLVVVSTGKALRVEAADRTVGEFNCAITACALSPNGRMLVYAENGVVHVVETEGMRERAQFSRTEIPGTVALAINDAGTGIAAFHRERFACLFGPAGQEKTVAFLERGARVEVGVSEDGGNLRVLPLRPPEPPIATLTDEELTAKVVALRSGREWSGVFDVVPVTGGFVLRSNEQLLEQFGDMPQSRQALLTDFAAAAEGVVAYATPDNGLLIRQGGRTVHEIRAPGLGKVTALAVGRDRVALADSERGLRLLRLAGLAPLAETTLAVPPSWVGVVGDELWVWDAEPYDGTASLRRYDDRLQCVGEADQFPCIPLALDPSRGRVLGVGLMGGTYLVTLDGDAVASLETKPESSPVAAAFTPDGKALYVGTSDAAICEYALE